MNTSIYPKALKKGDLIALVFPASYYLVVDDTHALEILQQNAQWLEQQGFRTICYPERVNRIGYLAGTDRERASALMNAWKNDAVKAIWCVIGGYGSMRMVDYLDYDFIKNHPKILLGMSDITVLHQAIQKKTGLVTFLAPVLNYFTENCENDRNLNVPYALSSFETILIYPSDGEISLAQDVHLAILRPGKAQGKLAGGNLTLIASLCGTQWQLDTKERILVLEDVSENFDQIDRSLWQLKNCGLLDQPAGIILGTWVNCTPYSEFSLTLEQVFENYFKDVVYPVISGFPTGHDNYQVTLPLNVLAEIDANNKTVKLMESVVILDD